MATPADYERLLRANLKEDQRLALRCELGPLTWRIAVGALTGHYVLDLEKAPDRAAFDALRMQSDREQAALKRGGCADVSQAGGWSGLLRNVRVDRKPFAGSLEAGDLPKRGKLSVDVVSGARPDRFAEALDAPAFAGLCAALRASEWKAASNPPDNRRKKNSKILAKKKKAAAERKKSGAGRRGGGTGILKGGRGEAPASDPAFKSYEPAWPARHGKPILGAETTTAAAAALAESSPLGFRTHDLDLETGNLRAVLTPDEADALRDSRDRAPTPKQRFKGDDDEAKKEVKDPANPRLRFTSFPRGAGGAWVLDDEEASELHVPRPEPLAWLSLRLIDLEARVSTAYVTAAQAAVLWNFMPETEIWAEVRVALLGILYRRCVESHH